MFQTWTSPSSGATFTCRKTSGWRMNTTSSRCLEGKSTRNTTYQPIIYWNTSTQQHCKQTFPVYYVFTDYDGSSWVRVIVVNSFRASTFAACSVSDLSKTWASVLPRTLSTIFANDWCCWFKRRQKARLLFCSCWLEIITVCRVMCGERGRSRDFPEQTRPLID